jgi:hypothetical protein
MLAVAGAIVANGTAAVSLECATRGLSKMLNKATESITFPSGFESEASADFTARELNRW